MHVTLEQARALDAFSRAGSYAAAARELHKGHTAVVYALKQLEEQTGLELLDRSGYRTQLTAAGRRVLEHCRRLLDEERALEAALRELKSGWEPELRIVFDGLFPAEALLDAVSGLADQGAPTRVDVVSDFLSGVERTFETEGADLMIAVLPPTDEGLVAVPLAPVEAALVAHRDHPLVQGRRGRTMHELSEHLLLTVRGSDPRLQLPTAALTPRRVVHLSDFHAKKAAILRGLGFGWLPTALVAGELEAGRVVRLRLRGVASTHTFRPRLLHRRGVPLGRAARAVVEALTGA